MNIKIDKEKCIGCGTCEALCPEIFQMGEDSKSELLPEVDIEKHKRCIQEAIEMCPVKAISKTN
ncbi:MAG: ferredoxin [bacterium]|nr:ferredoxin [bacterium]